MRKRIIALLMTMICVFQVFTLSAWGATEEENYTGNQLRILGILKGYTDGTLKLDNNISRAEVATLAVRVLGYDNTIIVGNEMNFIDVKKDYWGYNNIQNAYKLSVIKGYPSGEFKPQNDITYSEVISIMVNALGKGNDLEGAWPDNYLNRAKTLGIIPENSVVSPIKVVTRGEMAVIVWNTLLVKK